MNDETISNKDLFDEWNEIFINASVSSDFDAAELFGETNQTETDDNFFFNEDAFDNKTKSPIIDGWISVVNNIQPLVVLDTVRFVEPVWDKDYFKKQLLGKRLNIIKILGERYDKDGQVWLKFEVLESTGINPLKVGTKHWRLRKNIFIECYRKQWEDESLRQELVHISQVNLENARQEIWQQKCAAEKQQLDDLVYHIVNRKAASSNDIDNNNIDDHENNIEGEQGLQEYTIKPLSADEQRWVDGEWTSNVSEKMVACLRRYRIDKGWKPMDETNDCIVNDDIIRFFEPAYSGRYPHGKYLGRRIVIAKVIKVARQYYHLDLITSKGVRPYTKKKDLFRRKLETVRNGCPHRLYWYTKAARRYDLGKYLKKQFGSQQEYEDYIEFTEGNCKNPHEDDKSSNNIKINERVKTNGTKV